MKYPPFPDEPSDATLQSVHHPTAVVDIEHWLTSSQVNSHHKSAGTGSRCFSTPAFPEASRLWPSKSARQIGQGLEHLPSMQPTAPQSGPGRRRPGRPTKGETLVKYFNSTRPTQSSTNGKRNIHNQSASRSRKKLNEALERLWDEIPSSERTVPANGSKDNVRVCRADMVEMAIVYVKKLRKRVSEVEFGNTGVFIAVGSL